MQLAAANEHIAQLTAALEARNEHVDYCENEVQCANADKAELEYDVETETYFAPRRLDGTPVSSCGTKPASRKSRRNC